MDGRWRGGGILASQLEDRVGRPALQSGGLWSCDRLDLGVVPPTLVALQGDCDNQGTRACAIVGGRQHIVQIASKGV